MLCSFIQRLTATLSRTLKSVRKVVSFENVRNLLYILHLMEKSVPVISSSISLEREVKSINQWSSGINPLARNIGCLLERPTASLPLFANWTDLALASIYTRANTTFTRSSDSWLLVWIVLYWTVCVQVSQRKECV